MKLLLRLFLVLISLNFAYAQDNVEEAIDTYRSGQLTAEGIKAGKIVMQFAEESDLILIELSVEKAPWITNKAINEHISPQMLLAYIVGNVDSQLDKGLDIDSHCAGVDEVSSFISYLEKEGIKNEILMPARNSLAEAIQVGNC